MIRPRSTALTALLFFGSLLAFPSSGEAQGTRFLRQPSVGPNGIAFVHANDIWVVGRDGGQARRITSDEGAETEPSFSPDGRWIAFTGEYGGNQDVYVVAADGGQPRRLTWHPGADVVQGWTPDGKILFQSGRMGVQTRLWQFYTVSPDGGFPKALPVHQSYLGEMSDDGRMLAYQEIAYWDPEWRNHRGGQAQPVRVVDMASLELETPPWEGERQMDPTWMDGVVYYMSERDWASNVWAYDPRTDQERQITFHADFDVKSVDAGHGVVVYEQAGYLHEVNPTTGATRQLVIDANLRGYPQLLVIAMATTVVTNVVPNQAAAQVLFPVVFQMYTQRGEDPFPAVLCLICCTSFAFVTPYGSSTSLIVLGPGGYKAIDFLKYGLPINIFAALLISVSTAIVFNKW